LFWKYTADSKQEEAGWVENPFRVQEEFALAVHEQRDITDKTCGYRLPFAEGFLL
jgi:hypothetical protein